MHMRIQKHIRSLSNAELIQYVNAPADTYLPEALVFARKELEGRHLSAQQVSEAQEEIAAREAEKVADATAPLDPVWQRFAFMTSIFIFLPAWLDFRRTGRIRMARELMRLWLGGVIFWTIVSVLCVLLYFFLVRRSS